LHEALDYFVKLLIKIKDVFCCSKYCSDIGPRLIKTVRLRVPFVEDLLKDADISSNLRIVMLTRDPRGVMTSRSSMYWCENPHCSDPEFACKDLDDDLEAAVRLKNKYPGKKRVGGNQPP
jgi:hypothetical protein